MKKKNSLIRFSIFIFIQAIIATILIIVFQQRFLLKPVVVLGHLFVITSINLLIISLGLFLFSRSLFKYQKITKYIVSGSYGAFMTILYFTYIFAFLGKNVNSRIYTSQIVFGYLQYLNELMEAFPVNRLLVYSGLFIIPLFIYIFTLLCPEFFQQGILSFRSLILKPAFNRLLRYIKFNTAIALLLLGLGLFLSFMSHFTVTNRLFKIEEPFVSFALKNDDPFQGQTMPTDNEDHLLRIKYPKNIEFQKKNIIVIVADAVRSDHMSLFGYERKTSPFLDSLYTAGSLNKVDLSFSVAGASFAGINGILRSKIWANMGYNNFSMQQLLKDQGYDINFLVSGDHTRFYGLKSFYGDNSDFNYYIDGSMTKKHIVADDRIIFEGLENIRPYENNPSYFHFHLNSAHYAGIKLDKYKKFEPASSEALDVENYTNRYDNGILQADDYIKKIFQSLSAKGYLQNSIVVITADHGEALGERGEFGHIRNVYTNHILIPILIYDSEKVQYENMHYATSVDIAPTIIDRLGLPVPESWEGRSLFTKKNREFTFHQMGAHFAVIHSIGNMRLKYLFNNKTGKEELFELNTDLYETKNIINSWSQEHINRLRNQLSKFHIDQLEE